MALLPITIFPDPVLREKAKDVTEITPEILALLDDMLATMYAAPGIGLAAPQISVSKRLIVIDVEKHSADATGKPYKMINPVILETGGEMTVLEEGCLSLPHMDVDVARPEHVKISYRDITGNTHILEADGLLAKCIQHEIDHLDGKLIFDYLSPLKRDITLRRYTKRLKSAD